MKDTMVWRRLAATACAAGVATILASCGSTPKPAAVATPAPAPQALPAPPVAAVPADRRRSEAADPRAYRRDAAAHIYELNRQRIWKGRLHPLLYAIGVLQVEVDGRGNVRQLHWMRAPNHAPEVVREIERTVRAASPFPAPVRMGKVVYTDTWLWDRSGRFQLDTLTEGQDGE
jgi:periplasmic protein TonB